MWDLKYYKNKTIEFSFELSSIKNKKMLMLAYAEDVDKRIWNMNDM